MNILKSLIVSAAIISASCTPAHAVSNSSICIDVAGLVAVSSAQQYDDIQRKSEGLKIKYPKEELLALYSDFPWQMRSMWLEAIEFAYNNPSILRTPLNKAIWETGYENCMYWMKRHGF